MAKRKPKQQYFEGAEPETIPELDAAAESYREARDSRMNKLELEVARRNDLAELMKKHKLSEYMYDGHVVLFQAGTPKVKVKDINDEKDED